MNIFQDKRFPSTVVDDFFDNPNEVLAIAETLDYTPADNGMFAGVRTKSLHEAHPQLHDYLTNRFMSVFYDFNYADMGWNATSFFHRIPSYNDEWLNKSWIHVDPKAILAGLVYLTPDADLNSGTSLYKLRDGELLSLDTTPRIEFHKNNNTDGYVESLKKHNDKFVETVAIKNVFNRLVAYDANTFHAANSYHAGNKDRLTLVFFIYNIEGNTQMPLQRIRNMPQIGGWKL